MGAPSAGVLTSIHVRAGGPAANINAVFLRPASALSSSMNFTKFAPNVPIALTEYLPVGGRTVDVPIRQTVAIGDRVGLSVPSGVSAWMSYIGPSLCGFISALDSQAVGDVQTFVVNSCNSNSPAVQATLEPDADLDGFGDESQDLCPTDATRQTACLPVVLPANVTITAVKSRAKTASSATRSFTITNSGGTAAALVPITVKSSKSVKNLKIVKGCKPGKNKSKCTLPSLAPGASVTIKVSLSIKAATKTTLTATAGTSTAKSTVKLKAKKK